MDAHDLVDELVENALRYAGRDAAVVLHLRAEDGTAVVEVSDTGPGLPDDELARALDRFWRSPTHHGTDGTGLGLAIVAQLARANGGALELAANEPTGLRVRLSLPAAEST
jgi:signal transduction histidine kinase